MARKASTFPESMGPLFRRGPTPTPKKIRVGLVRGELFIDRNQNPDARTAPAEPCGDSSGDSREPARTQVRVPPARPAARPQDSPSYAPPGPRLLTRQEAADYLNLSSDMIDRLTQQGELPRVQLVLGNRNVRKVLYDRADLDRLVELSRVV
jgi:excisionase family DNA binding protein